MVSKQGLNQVGEMLKGRGGVTHVLILSTHARMHVTPHFFLLRFSIDVKESFEDSYNQQQHTHYLGPHRVL